MAYTRVWDTEVLGTPPGSRDSDEIDDAIREFKVDVSERLADLVFDINADPLVLKTPGVAIDGSVTFVRSAVPCVSGPNAVVRGPYQVNPGAAGASAEIYFPIDAQQGSTLRAFSIDGYRTVAGASVQASLIEVDKALQTSTALATVSLASGVGVQSATSGLINALMSSTKAYYVVVNMLADASGAATAAIVEMRFVVKLAGTP